ncbi:4-(cytidine 5'-diphospho)-2-C-methyl-D-erythritol kinase [Oceanobacillus piezotolerans]|uniref:4-diphosphocytidyl-2-C-methyl-D-erythritol kinase n=1 Tax=Oceanobacillus piezotolerans TaxID=2448030 RepID=A0A498DA23_9BACI|nr:4-(cytidine 5'-diphospho)-2-C-methyl-D-erythritol kinase [Oceanobacillus piezotolerans]RLL41688.1 4-(cytidine 5'-diphospho)-2-C-methyl-D-erythritol kinase [Oceanobacillus piezotolerans]
MALFEKAPAKINLSLDVLSKREDGLHNVEMIMTTIDLSDRIELSSIGQDTIKISLESRYVPNDERNLAYRAAALFKRTYGINKGVHIKIEKNIPVSAGLGGGSADAAAVLRGLNRLWGMDIPLQELAALGSKLGADISFCVYGNTAIARGFGEKIETLTSPPPCWVVLAKPDIGVSTRTIFERVSLDTIYHPNTNEVIKALYEKDLYKLCANMGNSLEAITGSLHPEVIQIKQAMKSIGATGVMMSGSGPTVFGLVEHENKAKRVYNGIRGFCDEVYLVRLIG